jgi:hypothetical protein
MVLTAPDDNPSYATASRERSRLAQRTLRVVHGNTPRQARTSVPLLLRGWSSGTRHEVREALNVASRAERL